MILVKDNVERYVSDSDTAKIAKLKEVGYKEVAAGETKAPKKEERKEYKVEELRQIAKESGIEGASALSKEELKEVLKEKGLI